MISVIFSCFVFINNSNTFFGGRVIYVLFSVCLSIIEHNVPKLIQFDRA